jgi:hypothetical protein
MMSDAAIPEHLEHSMNRTAATCIAGIRSKTRIHFFRRPREAKPFTRFSAAFHGKKTTTEQQVSFY